MVLQNKGDFGFSRNIQLNAFFCVFVFGWLSADFCSVADALNSKTGPVQAKESNQKKKLPRPGFDFIQEFFPNLQYQVKSFGTGYTSHGYRQLSVTVTNDGEKKYSIQLVADFYGERLSYLGRHTGTASSKTVDVGPGSTVKLTVYAPNLTANLNEIKLMVDKKPVVLTLRSGGDFTHITGPYSGSESSLTFFVSPDIDSDAIANQIDAAGLVVAVNRYSYRMGYSSYSYRSYGEVEYLEVMKAPPAKEWADNWLAYSPLAHIIVTRDFYDTLPQTVKDALRDYVAAGGVIAFLESKDFPERYQGPLGSVERPAKNYRGQASNLKYIEFGLGYVCRSYRRVRNMTEIDWGAMLRKDRRQFYQSIAEGNPEENLKLFEEEGINKNLIFYGVFAFVLIVGPVNLLVCRFYFSNLMMLVITTPAFSVLISLLFVVGDYFSQGTRPTTVVETFTILDQQNNRSISCGRTGYYTPMRAGELRFDLQTEVLPYLGNQQTEPSYYGGRASDAATIRFEDNDQFLSTGWVESRKQTYFNFRQVKRSDLKVDIQRNSQGNLEMINGLGVDIVRFLYQDEEGNTYFNEMVKAGEKVVLEKRYSGQSPPKENFVSARLHTLRPALGRDVFKELFNQGRPGPRHYLAETEASPFFESIQERTIEKSATSFVYGILEDSKK